MRFRASNLFLLSGIVLAIAAAIIFTGRSQQDASDASSEHVATNSKVLQAWLGQVLGLGFIYTGEARELNAFVKGGKEVDIQISALREATEGQDDDESDAVETEVAALRAFQDAAKKQFELRRADPSGSIALADQLGLGLNIAAVSNANQDYNAAVESNRRDAQSRTNRVSMGAVGLLGLLIMTLGLTARRDDRRRRAHRRFGEGLQAARTETEAYGLLRTHLEQAVNESDVAVFSRNESADRLESSTPLRDDSELGELLRGAKPDDCLAVRTAKPSAGGRRSTDFLRCDVCGKLSGGSLCVPSIVGGEVIGAVLVRGKRVPGEGAQATIVDSVSDAAPVVANLRSLAIAERQAASDLLTGLPNKRSAEDTLKQLVAKAARAGRPLALLLFDLDHFKSINDSFGHPKGDEVLAAVGSATADQIRGEDFAARFGGEEFLVLLPGSDREAGRLAAEKLRTAIGALTVPGVSRGVTASFGVAAIPADADGRDDLVRMADRALYTAKRSGRNRVETSADVADAGPTERPVEPVAPPVP